MMNRRTSARPHILLTNDDGIEAAGLRVLADALAPLGRLTIVAPRTERSGSGHAISFLKDMACEPVARDGRPWGWALDGTPADCVKVALHHLAPDPIDLVMAGINCGQNAGTNVHYSGTVGAAREAALHGLPAVALSLRYYDPADTPFETAARVGVELARRILAGGLPRGVLLNVNVPPLPFDALRGWAIVPMGTAGFTDRIVVQSSGGGAAVFRNVGDQWVLSPGGGALTDDQALEAGMVAITPLQCDQTAYALLDPLRTLLDGHAAALPHADAAPVADPPTHV